MSTSPLVPSWTKLPDQLVKLYAVMCTTLPAGEGHLLLNWNWRRKFISTICKTFWSQIKTVWQFGIESMIRWRNHICILKTRCFLLSSFLLDSICCGFSAFILSPANQSCLLTSYTSYRADLGVDCGKPNIMRFEFYRRTRKTSL